MITILGGTGFIKEISEYLQSDNIEHQCVADYDTTMKFSENCSFLIAIGDNRIRQFIYNHLSSAGHTVLGYNHSSCLIGEAAKIGAGFICCPYTVITSNARIGKMVNINVHCGIGHDAVIGDFCNISAFCDVTGHAELGEGVFLGTSVKVLPGIKVGAWSIVGAGSTVTKDIPANCTAVGSPARVIKLHE